jgi:GNAT superfamily N-acetyltransferase
MKGLKIERAAPSNAIDIYALLKEAATEKCFPLNNPTGKQLEQYYFQTLIINELPNPLHFWYLAKRGRGFLGLLHCYAVPGRWDGKIDTLFVDILYVVEKRRKMGIGKKLIEEMKKEAENVGIKRLHFLAEPKVEKLWRDREGAKKKTSIMEVLL